MAMENGGVSYSMVDSFVGMSKVACVETLRITEVDECSPTNGH